MERMSEAAELDLLRSANDLFRRFFARFAGAAVQGSQEEVDAMLQLERTLESVGILLDRGVPRDCSPVLRAELGSYRENLLRLRRELASMQESAISSHGRLFVRREHLAATQAWCATARSTR